MRKFRSSTKVLTGWKSKVSTALGYILAVYLGLWVCTVGGIVQIIDAAKEDPTNGWMIFWGILRILCSLPAAIVAPIIFWIIMDKLFGSSKEIMVIR